MNLAVDYGNSAAKVAIFDQHALTEKHTFTHPEDLKSFLSASPAENFIISSVITEAEAIAQQVKAKNKFILSHTLPLPVNILYTTPHTLGVDRLAASCGAVQLFPGKNTLVIDAGTCITYDFTDSNRQYYGGGISPGLKMRFQAVHTFTARLPLVNPAGNPELVGNSTETSIQSGVVNGTLAEIDGIINRYRQKYPDLQVILCGGDAPFFENKLKASIFASPDLVLIGLNRVLIHNVRL
ncbi:MAG TPA: type III pantothenate kinase [Cyclobacteriaceae bacterium]|nr:type III pantothenate kinase [Cyclobacteriaceae bacterium]